MRKLLTIGALILSVNMFAAVSIIGPGLNMNIGGSIKGVSNYSLNAGTTTITLSGASTIDAGNTFTVASGGTLAHKRKTHKRKTHKVILLQSHQEEH